MQQDILCPTQTAAWLLKLVAKVCNRPTQLPSTNTATAPSEKGLGARGTNPST